MSWTEVKNGSEGISVTMYSENKNGEPVVEEELWFTHDELQNESNQGTYILNEK